MGTEKSKKKNDFIGLTFHFLTNTQKHKKEKKTHVKSKSLVQHDDSEKAEAKEITKKAK